MRLSLILLTMTMLGCSVLSTEPDEFFRIGVLTPDSRVVFFAEVEPRDTIFWRIAWREGQDVYGVEGFEPRRGVVAIEAPFTDRDMKWVAHAGHRTDSLFWAGW